MRRSMALAVILVAALGLAACGSSGASSAGSGPVTISFWNGFTGDDRPGVEALVKQFNDSQSTAKVDMTIMPGDVLGQKLLPAFQSKTGPTIVALDPSQVPGFADKRVIQPIDDIYGHGALDVSTLPAAQIAATTWKGKRYGVPMSSATAMLYYNKKLLAAAGFDKPTATLEGLTAQAVALTHYKAGQDTTNQYGLVIADHASVPVWSSLIWSWGGGIVAKDGKSSEFGSNATVNAVAYWTDLMRQKHISPIGLSGVDAGALFQAGRAALNIEGPWASTGYSKAGIDFGVVPAPAGPVEQMSVAVGAAFTLNSEATANQRKAALDFMTYWNSAKSQTSWSIQTSYPPNRTDVNSASLSANPTAEAFSQKQQARFFPGGAVLDFAKIQDSIFIPSLQRITNGAGTSKDVLKSGSDAIDAALK